MMCQFCVGSFAKTACKKSLRALASPRLTKIEIQMWEDRKAKSAI